LVLLLLLGGGATGAWWWWQQRQKPAPQTAAQVTPPQTAAPVPTPAAPPPQPVAEPTPAAPVEPVLTNDAVLQMVEAKVPISQINQQIRSSKTNFTLTPEEILRLRKAGVPAAVIQAMRNPKGVTTTPAAGPTSSQPTVATTTPPATAPPPVRATPTPKTSSETAPASRRPVIQTVPVTVNDALPFRIVLSEDVAANGQEGQALRFTVVDGFKVGDTVVIPPGATVTGSITSEAGKKFLGIGNKMTFRLLQADAVDGQKINVRSKSGKQANGPTTRPFDTGKNPKTKGLAASQGTEYIAYIDGDQTVSVRK
jgi:hypothetical protein